MPSNLRSTEIRSVAMWMLNEIGKDGVLYQNDAACRMLKEFGEWCCYYTDSGHLAISRPILRRFNYQATGTVKWFPNTKSWRKFV